MAPPFKSSLSCRSDTAADGTRDASSPSLDFFTGEYKKSATIKTATTTVKIKGALKDFADFSETFFKIPFFLSLDRGCVVIPD